MNSWAGQGREIQYVHLGIVFVDGEMMREGWAVLFIGGCRRLGAV